MIDKAWVECEEMEAERVCSFFVGGALRCERKRKEKSSWSRKQNQKRVLFFFLEKFEC